MDLKATAMPLLEHKEYDVTATCASVICCGCIKSTVSLEPEEAVKTDTSCFGTVSKRLPYGELGMVDKITACGCCIGFRSNLSDINPKTKKLQPITPGCGCESTLVEEIVAELKLRMKGRGDTGNIHRSEEAIIRMRYLNEKMELLLKNYGVALPPNMISKEASGHKMEVFEHKDYDISPICHKMCCGSQKLDLEPEEVLLVTTTPCATDTRRFPYGQLGDVAEAKVCCCVAAQSKHLGAIRPGLGCEYQLVNEVTMELKRRMKARGDTGNIQRQEFANSLAKDQDKMLNAVLEYMRIPVPQVPPELQQMR